MINHNSEYGLSNIFEFETKTTSLSTHDILIPWVALRDPFMQNYNELYEKWIICYKFTKLQQA